MEDRGPEVGLLRWGGWGEMGTLAAWRAQKAPEGAPEGPTTTTASPATWQESQDLGVAGMVLPQHHPQGHPGTERPLTI